MQHGLLYGELCLKFHLVMAFRKKKKSKGVGLLTPNFYMHWPQLIAFGMFRVTLVK